MVSIIICDDSREFSDRLCVEIGSVLDKLRTKAKILTYIEMERIPDSILSGCDIAFLDIDFEGKRYNGIDIARRIRSKRKDAVIIFVTNYIEYAPEGYEINAFRYVLKSEISRKLPQYLQEALAQIQTERATLTIRNSGEQIVLALSEILYLESQQHTVTLHTKCKEYRCYKSLSALEEELQSKGFLRIHNSYLVNMAQPILIRALPIYAFQQTNLRERTGMVFSQWEDGNGKKADQLVPPARNPPGNDASFGCKYSACFCCHCRMRYFGSPGSADPASGRKSATNDRNNQDKLHCYGCVRYAQ